MVDALKGVFKLQRITGQFQKINNNNKKRRNERKKKDYEVYLYFFPEKHSG